MKRAIKNLAAGIDDAMRETAMKDEAIGIAKNEPSVPIMNNLVIMAVRKDKNTDDQIIVTRTARSLVVAAF